ncbi:hypothetical protein CH35J_011624 [Colletotrichum higginsianum]|uniref:Uncharacterized protein n=1 Tax=Colletotrichum higginsianum TaxID=80884 RepID=A0A4T0VEN1_9PEZI|nr:hypothetical protein CH35J_011624 [Colletotrichum higginsianum]
MPFLRRRGNVVSETDMRRHTIIDTESVPQLPQLPQHFPSPQPQSQQQQQQPPRPQSQQHQKQPFIIQPQEAQQLQPLLPPLQGQQQEKEQGQHGEEPRPSVSASTQESRSTLLAVPAQSEGDGDEPGQQTPNGSGDRPNTPPVQEETPKHRRFSMLRFRNASDSQLSLRAKQQAEKPPLCLARPKSLQLLRLSIFRFPKRSNLACDSPTDFDAPVKCQGIVKMEAPGP